jgi:hypothetical protein
VDGTWRLEACGGEGTDWSGVVRIANFVRDGGGWEGGDEGEEEGKENDTVHD